MRAGRKVGTFLWVTAILAALVCCAVAFCWQCSPLTVLPNGLILRDNDLLTRDQRTVLARDIEFLCFDDQFVIVGVRTGTDNGLFDEESSASIAVEGRPEVFMPGGLKYGRRACNGYYTSMVGPQLLVAGNRPPFLPNCTSVNRENAALKDQSWLNRPCAGP